jgi:DNA polymerase-3 subunit beta
MLKLSATNLEIAMTTWVGAMIEEEGSITVPARLLTEFVNSLPNDKIDLELEQGSGLLEISSGNSKAHINITDASEFPPIPTVDDGVTAEVDPLILKNAIARVAFAASS